MNVSPRGSKDSPSVGGGLHGENAHLSRSERRQTLSRSERRQTLSRSERRQTLSRSERRQTLSRSERRHTLSRSERRHTLSRSERRLSCSRPLPALPAFAFAQEERASNTTGDALIPTRYAWIDPLRTSDRHDAISGAGVFAGLADLRKGTAGCNMFIACLFLFPGVFLPRTKSHRGQRDRQDEQRWHIERPARWNGPLRVRLNLDKQGRGRRDHKDELHERPDRETHHPDQPHDLAPERSLAFRVSAFGTIVHPDDLATKIEWRVDAINNPFRAFWGSSSAQRWPEKA